MAVNFRNQGLYLEAPKFDYTNTPRSQAQNAAGLVNIANSFNVNQENSPRWGTIAANGAANRIAKDATWMQQAGSIIGAKHTAETNEKINSMKLAMLKDKARDEASEKMGGSIGSLIGGGIGLVASGGNPLFGAIGSKVGGTFGSFLG